MEKYVAISQISLRSCNVIKRVKSQSDESDKATTVMPLKCILAAFTRDFQYIIFLSSSHFFPSEFVNVCFLHFLLPRDRSGHSAVRQSLGPNPQNGVLTESPVLPVCVGHISAFHMSLWFSALWPQETLHATVSYTHTRSAHGSGRTLSAYWWRVFLPNACKMKNTADIYSYRSKSISARFCSGGLPFHKATNELAHKNTGALFFLCCLF